MSGGHWPARRTTSTRPRRSSPSSRRTAGEAAVNDDDISSWDGAEHVVEQAIDTYGSLDILVNNAGIVRDKMSFNTDESDWDDVIRVHLKGHFAPIRHAAAYWRNRAKAGEEVVGSHHQHDVGGRALRQSDPGQLRRGQGGDRRARRGSSPASSSATASRSMPSPPGPAPA